MSHKVKVRTAIIGVGRWGKNVAKELDLQSELVAYASRTSRPDETWMKECMPHAKRHSLEELSERKDIDAFAVATPIATHADIVRTLLSRGKHVLCEKPLAEDSKTAHELVGLAKQKDALLMTGYVYLYHPAYQKLRADLAGKKISRIEFQWNKWGTFLETIEMNLLTHHFAILFDLLGMPATVRVTRREAGESVCDVLETVISYPECEVISRINRISKERAHIMSVYAEGKTYVWEGAQLRDAQGLFESRDTPLALEIQAFLEAVGGSTQPPTAYDFGAHVLRIHELLH